MVPGLGACPAPTSLCSVFQVPLFWTLCSRRGPVILSPNSLFPRALVNPSSTFTGKVHSGSQKCCSLQQSLKKKEPGFRKRWLEGKTLKGFGKMFCWSQEFLRLRSLDDSTTGMGWCIPCVLLMLTPWECPDWRSWVHGHSCHMTEEGWPEPRLTAAMQVWELLGPSRGQPFSLLSLLLLLQAIGRSDG